MKILNTLFVFAISAVFSFANAGFSTASDGEFATISGKVTKVGPDAFYLMSKGKRMLVEMDDYDWDADGYKLKVGDSVVVNGKVDKDFMEKRKLEAGSVYVKNINAYFYANSDDEEGAPFLNASYYTMDTIPENTSLDIQGRVVAISGRELVVDTGLKKIKVDTGNLIYNPLDDKGFTQIDLNDRVRISGIVDDSFFSGKSLSANFVAELPTTKKQVYSE